MFLLLETIYGSFDAAVRRRGVFKGELRRHISGLAGNCLSLSTDFCSYFAEAGLPKPQPHHAFDHDKICGRLPPSNATGDASPGILSALAL